jgi:hypothetical protein
LGRHFEKVVVMVALIGLVYAVGHLYMKKQSEDDKIREYDRGILKKKTKPVPAVDLGFLNHAIEQGTNPPALNFGLPHNLFNPVKWQKARDGSIIKIRTGTEIGPAALKITGVTPLNTVITLNRMAGSGVEMSALQEASTNRLLRRKYPKFFSSTNETDYTKLFTLREIRGTPEKPEAVVELATGERETVTPEKPYTKVEGYRVDMTYTPDGTKFTDKRVGDEVTLAGEVYIIVAINPTEVVVSARSNNRRTTIKYNAGQ